MNSPAWETTGGRMLHISGMIARDATGAVVAVGDSAGQARRCLDNLKSVLAAAGATIADVVKITIYVCDRAYIEPVRQVRTEYFTQPMPAATLVIVSGLADPRALVEIEATAVVDESSTTATR